MYFSTLPQDDVHRFSYIQVKNYRVARCVANVLPFEFPGGHLIMPILHQDGPRSVGAVAKSHEGELVSAFHWSSEDACERGGFFVTVQNSTFLPSTPFGHHQPKHTPSFKESV